MSGTKQRVLLAWFWTFAVITGVSLVTLMHMFPLPSATWSAERLAEWYQVHSLAIRIGATICAWTSGCFILWSVVAWAQASRVERGAAVWSNLILAGFSTAAVFQVLPFMAWGTAAYSPNRGPEITQVMHEFGALGFVTSDQLYIFAIVSVAVLCFTTPDSPGNPFPRWWGWVTAGTIIVSEVGVLAFVFKSGPFALNGILSLWIHTVVYMSWVAGQTWLILKALKVQESDELTAGDAEGVHAVPPSLVPADNA